MRLMDLSCVAELGMIDPMLSLHEPMSNDEVVIN